MQYFIALTSQTNASPPIDMHEQLLWHPIILQGAKTFDLICNWRESLIDGIWFLF